MKRFLRARKLYLGVVLALAQMTFGIGTASAADVQSPEQFLGFRVGADRKLARWDKIVEYLERVASESDRVNLRDLGKTTDGNRFVMLEVSAPETIRNLDRYKILERKLYFQNGAPTTSERDEIFRDGKSVVLVTCNVHATEIGSSQMVLELVHRLATEDSPYVKKILDNTIFLLVPSLNPDGQIMITDWYNKNLGTEYEASPLPQLYHPYVGHDNNRDMYMFTQAESRLTARLLWHDWFPSVWLDEHQMGSTGPRIFVMPATDPINPNVHPLIYRWTTTFGGAQAAALEAEGKEGIIHDWTFTSFWPGAMAWTGWWHNQIGLLTELASVRIATPTEQLRAQPGARQVELSQEEAQAERRRQIENPTEPLPAPRDTTPRNNYPRPWMGGKWTLRDIVDYELTATYALLETAADNRELLLRQIYEVNRSTVEAGSRDGVSAILIREDAGHDPRAAARLVDKLLMGGVEVDRATSEFEVDGRRHPAGTFVVRMNQVFARYAKDLLEKQTYPEVRRAPSAPAEPPYDVTAWSLGMQIGVGTEFISKPLPNDIKLVKLAETPKRELRVTPTGDGFTFDYKGADAVLVVNRLLKANAQVGFATSNDAASRRVNVRGIDARKLSALLADFDVRFDAVDKESARDSRRQRVSARVESRSNTTAASTTPAAILRAPRIGLYQGWTANMDEGWTRWVLEQHEFAYTTLHNADMRAQDLSAKYDVIILPDQQAKDIVEGFDFKTIRPEYRGGIGAEGVKSLQRFVAQGGTLVALGASSDLVINNFPIPVRNLKKSLTRDQHFAPGTILPVQIDTSHTIGYGLPATTHGFYTNTPFFQIVEGFASHKASVVARYPNADLLASGWLRGEDHMAGRAAVVSIDTNPGRIVLFGLRPQHRAQTQATFPLFFNALYLSAADERRN